MDNFCECGCGKIANMKIGKGCKISDKASIYGSGNIEIGDNVRIDDFCILSGGSGLKIGSHIHIGAYNAFYAGGGIVLEDFSQFGPGSIFLSESDDFSGNSLIGPCIPKKFKPLLNSGLIYIGKHVVIGARCVVLPKVNILEGVAVGACSLVIKDCEPWMIYAGIPAKTIKQRCKGMIKLEHAFLEERMIA